MERGFKKITEAHNRQAFNLLLFGSAVTSLTAYSALHMLLFTPALPINKIILFSAILILAFITGINFILKSNRLFRSGLGHVLINSPGDITAIIIKPLAASLTCADVGITRLNGITLHIQTAGGKVWDMIIEDTDFVDIYYFLYKTAAKLKIEANLFPGLDMESALTNEIAA